MAEISWGIMLAAYLFVGGMAGGAYMVASMADLFGKGKYKVLSKSGTYISLVSMIVGLVLLVLDLGRFSVDPLGALNAYINFPTSIMSVGTWIITAFIVISLITSILWFFQGSGLIRKISEIAGLILGCSTAAYTGLLLAFARGRPFWASPFLPMTFIISGTLTGLVMALLLIPIIAWLMPRFFEDFKALFQRREDYANMLRETERHITFLSIVEIMLIILFIGTTQGGVFLLTNANISIIFYVYLILGLLIPLGIGYYIGRSEKTRNEMAVIYFSHGSYVLTLLGGFLLRYVILYGGQLIA